MATMREMALGVAGILQHSDKPEPLPVDLWGDAPNEGAELVRAVLAECHDAGIPLTMVRVRIPMIARSHSDMMARSVPR